MKAGRDDMQRFWGKVKKADQCWEWQSALVKGYGQFHYNGKTVLAHRFIWAKTHGAIQDGLFVCHHCDNRKCVRIEHLFLGTQSDNMRDCVNKKRHVPSRRNRLKTHCASGHAYAGDNLVITKEGWRRCRTCQNASRMRTHYRFRLVS